MRQVYTQIQINASPDRVWEILTDFYSYPEWNPLIRSLSGTMRPGENFQTSIQLPGSKPMNFRPVCLKWEPGKAFSWKGKLLMRGIFDGEHQFELSEPEPGKTTLVHKENFSGILVPLIWKKIEPATQEGFILMNQALKERAEAA